MSRNDRPNSFENFFEEPFYYGDDGYGWAVIAKDTYEARDKMLAHLNYEDRGGNSMNRLSRELRENMRECFVKWQGFTDDNGEFANGWVITPEKKWGQPRWKTVYESNYDRHYVEKGHRYEPKADEAGHRVHYSFNKWNCDVCNQIDELQKKVEL